MVYLENHLNDFFHDHKINEIVIEPYGWIIIFSRLEIICRQKKGL